MKLWGGRFTKETDKLVNNFNASISFDQKFYKQDILGSIAHVTMLEKQGILTTSEKDAIPFCVGNGIAFVPFSPVASGLLSGKITPDTEFGQVDDVRVWVPQLKRENITGNMPIVEMLRSFAAEKQATPAQVSLAWMLRKYTNVVPIPGSKNKERIMENLRACEMQLTDEEFDRLDSELDRLPVYGIRGHAETEQTSFGNNWLKLK